MSRQFGFAPDPGGGSAGDVRLMLTVSVKAMLRPGAVRARGVRRTPLGWQPIPCLPQWQSGGRRKVSLTLTRAARPEGRGVIDKRGETMGFAPLARSVAAQATISARFAKADTKQFLVRGKTNTLAKKQGLIVVCIISDILQQNCFHQVGERAVLLCGKYFKCIYQIFVQAETIYRSFHTHK